MIPKPTALIAAAFAISALVPTAALASDPGSGGALPPGAKPAPGEPAPPPVATPRTAWAQGANGMAITVRTGGIVRKTMRVRGTAPARHTVAVQALSPGGTWSTVATTKADAHGEFVARWRAGHIGRYKVRAVPARSATRAVAAADPPVLTVTVYHQDTATWYGPGFYGRKMACGGVLTHATLGVAHRTLPCGTPVSIMFEGRSIVVPVVDRGPFANGANLDLTEATAKLLGMTGTSQVGEVALVGSR